jgi:outer membrane biosynthesis protein TonB
MEAIFSNNNNSMPKSLKIALIASALFHVSVLLIGTLGLPYISKKNDFPPAPIAIEVVDFSELTTTNKPPSQTRLKPVPDKPKEEPKQEKKVEAPPKVDVKEPPRVKPLEKIPEKKEETVKPKAETPLPPSESLEKPKPAEPKKEEPKEEAIQQDDPLASLMKNLQETDDTSEADSTTEGVAENSPDAPMAEYVTAHELNALTNQLIGCWQIPIGAKNVNDMVVKVRIWANSDRTVKRVEVEDQWRVANDPAFRALAESAKRAVLDPYCSPLNIPMEKYDVWKNQYIVVPFDPSRVT